MHQTYTPAGPLLAVIAHPDDELLLAGLIAETVAAGFPVQIACFSKGEAGLRNPEQTPADLGDQRVAELRAACRALGTAEPIMLTPLDGTTFPDENLHLVDPDAGVGALLPIYKQFQPQLVVGFPDDGVTGHPGHTWASRVALAAHDKAAPPGARFWQPVPTPSWAALPLDKFMFNHQPLRIYPLGALALYRKVQSRAKKIAAIRAHPSQSASLNLLWPAIIQHEAYIELP